MFALWPHLNSRERCRCWFFLFMCYFTVVIHIRLNCACHSSSKFVIEMACARFSSHRPVYTIWFPSKYLIVKFHSVYSQFALVQPPFGEREKENDLHENSAYDTPYTYPQRTHWHMQIQEHNDADALFSLSIYILASNHKHSALFFFISPTKCSHVFLSHSRWFCRFFRRSLSCLLAPVAYQSIFHNTCSDMLMMRPFRFSRTHHNSRAKSRRSSEILVQSCS